jgi:hypothetical protein
VKPKFGLFPGARLSDHFTNRRDCYKVVEVDNVLGYIVSSGGPGNTAAIYPLYRASIYVKGGRTWHIVTSYEQGKRLNDFTFHTDHEGCTFATIAAQAIRALEERKHVQPRVKQARAEKQQGRTEKRALPRARKKRNAR